jgi:serine/threonine protein kinase
VATTPVRIGSYRIERLLGIGSFATVWLGYDASLGARVAIKVLAENWSHDLRVRERFLEEARLLWRLDNDRIVTVYALGELPDGRPYSVMAWADGGSLRDRLAQGPIPVREGMPLLREICAGVAVLHEHGVVHRDLAPGNVLFRSRPRTPRSKGSAEQVIIADLGLAKALAAASGLTARAGTPGYMAPEQDDPLAVVDRRTDVFGLGQLGVRLLGSSMRRRLDQPVRLRDGVPRRVADVLRSATARRPADRYPDAAALGAALSRATLGRRMNPAGAATARAAMVLASATMVSFWRPTQKADASCRGPAWPWTRPVGSRSIFRRSGAPRAAGGLAQRTPAGRKARHWWCPPIRLAGAQTRPCGARSSGSPGPAPLSSRPPHWSPGDRTPAAPRHRFDGAGRPASTG